MEAKDKKKIILNLSAYSLTHALVDAACAAIVLSRLSNNMDIQYFAFLVILYNVMAFGLQAPFGLVVDKIKRPVGAAALGCLLVAFSAVISGSALLAVCFSGLGNALFHVGGGIIALSLKSGKAAMPGIYVAPGALGLLIGTLFGKSGYFSALPLVILLLAASAVILIIDKPYISCGSKIKLNYDKFELTILLVLGSIAIRGLAGFMLNYPWKADTTLLVIFTSAVVLGKAFGGILADRFGWIKVTISGLAASAILLPLGYNYAFAGIVGVFLFNLTMPVTLVAVSNMLPGREGFAFGLTTLALLIGVFPTFTKFKDILCYNNKWLILLVVSIMTYILYKGLKLYFRSCSNSTYIDSNTHNF